MKLKVNATPRARFLFFAPRPRTPTAPISGTAVKIVIKGNAFIRAYPRSGIRRVLQRRFRRCADSFAYARFVGEREAGRRGSRFGSLDRSLDSLRMYPPSGSALRVLPLDMSQAL